MVLCDIGVSESGRYAWNGTKNPVYANYAAQAQYTRVANPQECRHFKIPITFFELLIFSLLFLEFMIFSYFF